MLVSITGTPGVGKTTVSNEMEKIGWKRIDLKELIIQRGLQEKEEGASGEIIVDIEKLTTGLQYLSTETGENIVLDGHLSYLAPSDICIVLRMDPGRLQNRLKNRGYSKEKVKENIEAEAVSVILIEAIEIEKERSKGGDWKDIRSGAGIVFEIDATGLSIDVLTEKVTDITDSYQGKRLNDLVEYRPGKVDWLEVVAEWS